MTWVNRRRGDTVDPRRVKEIFINVLDYKYLTVSETTKKPTILSFDREMYELVTHKEGETFEMWLEGWKKTYESDIRSGKAKVFADKIDISLKPHNYIELLYDVVCTNRLGQRLYRKVVFEVEEIGYHYLIVGFHER